MPPECIRQCRLRVVVDVVVEVKAVRLIDGGLQGGLIRHTGQAHHRIVQVVVRFVHIGCQRMLFAADVLRRFQGLCEGVLIAEVLVEVDQVCHVDQAFQRAGVALFEAQQVQGVHQIAQASSISACVAWISA